MRSNTTSPENTKPPERGGFHDTADIVAVATPPGRGGISIVRLSGPGIPALCKGLTGALPAPRCARLCDFLDSGGEAIDRGLALYFPSPHSYTGEHILELHGHGSPVVMKMLLRRCLELGARLARPGEFSERAFVNGRLDLAQAEAVADLIASSTESAARSAMHSLQGEFSSRIHDLVGELTELRIRVEAAIDFPEEGIDVPGDFLADERIPAGLRRLRRHFARLRDAAGQGRLLRDGLKVVLTGPPNAGKSSLLNVLCRRQRAIVSAIPGTTRDLLEQSIEIDGLPVEIVDTAGIRDSVDEIEIEGVRRAVEAQRQADLIMLVIDDADTTEREARRLLEQTGGGAPVCLVRNKIDLSGRPAGMTASGTTESTTPASTTPAVGTPANGTPAGGTPASTTPASTTPASGTTESATPASGTTENTTPASATPESATPASATPDNSVALSALSGDGMADLVALIKQCAGFRDSEDNRFIARQRHLDALRRAGRRLDMGIEQFSAHGAAELLAEELAACQRILGEITGEVGSDDLLGLIFSSFCIGK